MSSSVITPGSYLLLLLSLLSIRSHGIQEVKLGLRDALSSSAERQGRALGRLSRRKVSADTVPALQPEEEYERDFTSDIPTKPAAGLPAGASGGEAPAAASAEHVASKEETDTVPAVQPPAVYDRDFPSDGHGSSASTATATQPSSPAATQAPSSTPAPPAVTTVAPVTIQDLLPDDVFSRDYVSDDPAIPPGQTLFSYSLGVMNNASSLLREATDELHHKEKAAHEQAETESLKFLELVEAQEAAKSARAAYSAGSEALAAANATRNLLESSRTAAAVTAAKAEDAYRRALKATGNASKRLIGAMDEPNSIEHQATDGAQSSRLLARSLAELERSLADVRLSLSSTQSRVEGFLQTTPTCYNGWEQAPGCVTTFEYLGIPHTGCTNAGAIYYWCSFSAEYQGNYSSCTACNEAEQIVLQQEHEDLNKTYQELEGAASMSTDLLAQAQALESVFTGLMDKLSDAVPAEAQDEREVWLTTQAREEVLREVLALAQDVAEEAAEAYLRATAKCSQLQLELDDLQSALAAAEAREAGVQASFRNGSLKTDAAWQEVESAADRVSNISYDALLDLRSAYYEVNPPKSSAKPRTCAGDAAGLIVAALSVALSHLAGVRC